MRACARVSFNLRGGPILTFPGPKVWTPHDSIITFEGDTSEGKG